MDKRRAIQIMTRAAALYHADLEDQKVIFLYGVPAEVRKQLQAKSGRLLSIKSYEAAFHRYNFLHLTGTVQSANLVTDRSIALSFALILPDEMFAYYTQGEYSVYLNGVLEKSMVEITEEYKEQEDWEFMLMDTNRDDIKELCIKDSRGRIGIIHEVWGGLYLPGMLEIWLLGEKESNLLTDKAEWGFNRYFLNKVDLSCIKEEYGAEVNLNVWINIYGKPERFEKYVA